MKNFTKDLSLQILKNEISVEKLLTQYPEYKGDVLKEINAIINSKDSNLINTIIEKYTLNAKIASKKIAKSGYNEKTLNAFMPNIIKARFAIFLLQRLIFASSTNKIKNKTRLNIWDGFILQKLLFEKDLIRKPVSLGLFTFFWKFIVNKKVLLPLVNERGIYCFYTKQLINNLSTILDGKYCVEIATGDGTLTKFLKDKNINCIATDDFSWDYFINYPDFVEKANAKAALNKYNPEVVLCSWPVPNNSYEKHVFKTKSVELYIVIGTKNPKITGDYDAYYNAASENFTMELDERLSSLILPPSEDNAVYLFRRKNNFS